MPQFFIKELNGKIHPINVNNKTTASDVLRKLQKNGVEVNTLVLGGNAINGNTLMKNTTYLDYGSVHAIKKHRDNANSRGARTNARGNANARGARPNAGRRQNKNRNVKKVTSFLSNDYISKLKNLKDDGLSDEQIKDAANAELKRMVDIYLISALNKM